MRSASNLKNIKRAQKESLIFQKISELFREIFLEDKSLSGVSVSRVLLSDDKGVCKVLFYTDKGKDYFLKVLPNLILYKPSLRKALANQIKSRYTPELIFSYDESFEKQQRLEALLEEVKERDKQ